MRTGPDDQFGVDDDVLGGSAAHERAHEAHGRSSQAVEGLVDCRERRCVRIGTIDVVKPNDPNVARYHSPTLVDVTHRAEGQLIVRSLP